jgi:signal transduction histidine kinase
VVATGLALRTLRAQAELEASSRALLESRAAELEAFAGRVAHDLRDPLTAMSLRLSLARRAPPAELVPDLIRPLSEQIESLNRTIDALLTFARAGGRPDPDARAQVADVVRAVVADVEPLAREARAELRVEDLPSATVACASGALRSVVANLVHNALKYLDGGERRIVTLSADVRRGRVRVTIADTGRGVPPGQEQRVFEPFVRLQPAAARGIGLGLATVKRIVETHGGAVGVRPTPGGGASFWFELPLAGDAARALSASGRRRPSEDRPLPS